MGTKSYTSVFSRMLYDSPLHTLRGKIVFAAIMLLVGYLAADTWIAWLTPLEGGVVLLYGMLLAFLGSLFGLVFLRYLDRREPESWWFYVGALVFAVLFSTPPAAFVNVRSPQPLLTVGFNEEFWKVFPLLMLVFFAPTVVSGVRDGMIYGALGGFAFNISEVAVYVLRDSFPKEGFEGFSTQLSRLGVYGIGNHVIWAAFAGAGIGLAMQTKNRRTKILAPLGAYLLAALTHTFNDTLGILVLVGIAGAFFKAIGLDPGTNLADPAARQGALNQYMGPLLIMQGLVVNIIILPIEIYALLKSGNSERQIIQDELKEEVGTVVTPEEYQMVMDEKRFKLRGVPGYPTGIGRSIRNAQNSLAFHKFYLKLRDRPIKGDPMVDYYRAEVVRLRTAVPLQRAVAAE